MQLDVYGNILLSPLLQTVENEGFRVYNHVVSYFSDTDKAFVHVGKYPVDNQTSVEPRELDETRPLRIRLILPPTESKPKETAAATKQMNASSKNVKDNVVKS